MDFSQRGTAAEFFGWRRGGEFRKELWTGRWRGIYFGRRRVRDGILGSRAEIFPLSPGRSDHYLAGVRSRRYLCGFRGVRAGVPSAGEPGAAKRPRGDLGGHGRFGPSFAARGEQGFLSSGDVWIFSG